MTAPSSNNEDKDAWLLKIELKREELEEINNDEGIKKAMEDQAPTVEEENIPQPLPNFFTPTEIEAFKMIELARMENKYLTRENILLKEHIIALKGIIRKLEELLRSMCDYPSSPTPSSPTKKNWVLGMGTPLGNRQAWGGALVSYHHHTPMFTVFLFDPFGNILIY